MTVMPTCTCGGRVPSDMHREACPLYLGEPAPVELHWSGLMITLTPEQIAKVLNERKVDTKLVTVFGLTLTQIRELIIYYEAGTGKKASDIDGG